MLKRDLQWIRGALQSAIDIEHATMPVYAAAMYSLEVQNYPAYNVIRSVMMEEMLHMAAAANMVAALGVQPRIRQLNPTVLSQGLPGGIAPGFTARCAKLSKRQLSTFMRIETPDSLLPPEEPGDRDAQAPAFQTIGAFYEEIKNAIIDNRDSVVRAVRGPMKANQVGGNLGYACIDPLNKKDIIEQFIDSISLVQEQGEGAEDTQSAGSRSGHEPSHYARFAELRYGRRYTGPDDTTTDFDLAESQRRFYQGEPIEWPTVINMLAVPNDGYKKVLDLDPSRRDVEADLAEFDRRYTRMLAALDDSWNGPVEQGWPNLGQAVAEMNELRVISCFRILRQPVPPQAISQLADIYPAEIEELSELTDLNAPVYYGPRFRNQAARS